MNQQPESSNSYAGVGFICVAAIAAVMGFLLISNPASISTATTAAGTASPLTLWSERTLDVFAQGVAVLAGVLGVVALLRGIKT